MTIHTHYSYRRNGRRVRDQYRDESGALVEKLTNWQRKKWQQAGAPLDKASLTRFIRLQRDGTELFQGDILPPRRT